MDRRLPPLLTGLLLATALGSCDGGFGCRGESPDSASDEAGPDWGSAATPASTATTAATSTTSPVVPAGFPGYVSHSTWNRAPLVRLHHRWSARLPHTYLSSPRAADLTGDGVEDLVVGGGAEGYHGTLFAVDGATGERLWTARFDNEVYATPALAELTGDGIPDAVVGGRFNDVVAVDGATGERLWSLRERNSDRSFDDTHFNSAVPAGDVDNDGRSDFLVIQSGGRDGARPPGAIHLVGGTGKHLAFTPTPDDREAYAVPSILPAAGGTAAAVFGTGGETEPGGLHRMAVGPGAYLGPPKPMVRAPVKGFVAAPAALPSPAGWRAVAGDFDGNVHFIDVMAGEPMWSARVTAPGAPRGLYATPAVGRFAAGSATDVVLIQTGNMRAAAAEEGASLVWLDGKAGREIGRERLGAYSLASPLVADLDGDGFDDLIVTTMPGSRNGGNTLPLRLIVFDGHSHERALVLDLIRYGAGTPLLQDLDGNGRLDLTVITGMGLIRFELVTAADPRVVRGAYRGQTGRGVFEP